MSIRAKQLLMLTALLYAPNVAAQDEASPPQEAKRVVAIDHKLRAGLYFSVDPDCTVTGLPVIRVIDPPKNGEVTIASDSGFPAYARENLRFDCNRKRLEGMAVFYEPQKGFSGLDSFVLDIIFPAGNAQKWHYSIEVR